MICGMRVLRMASGCIGYSAQVMWFLVTIYSALHGGQTHITYLESQGQRQG